jgi:hypothetical protein
MKKIFQMMAFAAIALFTVTACGDDDDNSSSSSSGTGADAPVLTPAPYKDQAVDIDITSANTTDSQYSRLKKLTLTESGAYMMGFEEAAKSRNFTRANSALEYLFGKYTYSNGVYSFDNGLKISFTANGNNYIIKATLPNGVVIELTGTKATSNSIPTGTMTSNLCSRAWTISALRVRIIDKGGAVGALNIEGSVDLAKVKSWAESNNKHISDDIKTNTIVKGIIFSSSGLFAIN